jgi:hypothetical protein
LMRSCGWCGHAGRASSQIPGSIGACLSMEIEQPPKGRAYARSAAQGELAHGSRGETRGDLPADACDSTYRRLSTWSHE